MTAAQAVSASRGALHLVPFDWGHTRANLACTVRGTHPSVVGPLDTDLCFDVHGGLRLLTLTRPRCTVEEVGQLGADLARRFGEPVVSRSRPFASWQYQVPGSTVRLYDDSGGILDSCSVAYMSEAPPQGVFAPPRGLGDPFTNVPRPMPGTGSRTPGRY